MDGREQEDSLSKRNNHRGKPYRYNVDNLKEIQKKESKNPHLIIWATWRGDKLIYLSELVTAGACLTCYPKYAIVSILG